LTSIVVDSSVTGWTPAQLSAALLEDNIESRPLWKPMHLQPVFAACRSLTNGNSEQLFETGLTLPSGSALDEVAVARVLTRVGDFLDIYR
jgi:dTDP-4-amino-4,6-dideoxygalactose transaminase